MKLLKIICLLFIYALFFFNAYGCACINYTSRGASFVEHGQYDKAINILTLELSDNPNNYLAYFYRGVAYQNKNNYDRAIDDYTRSIELNRTYYNSFVNRGAVYLAKNNIAKALEDYDRAISLAPKNARTYLLRGAIYHYDLNKLDNALTDYNKALELDSKNIHAYVNRGRLFYDTKDFDKAFLDYNYAFSINPDSSKCCNDFAWVLVMCPDLKYKNTKRAFELAMNAIKVFPNPVSYDTLAAIYAENNDFAKAILSQKKAIELYANWNCVGDKQEYLNELKTRLGLYEDKNKWKELPGQHRAEEIWFE